MDNITNEKRKAPKTDSARYSGFASMPRAMTTIPMTNPITK